MSVLVAGFAGFVLGMFTLGLAMLVFSMRAESPALSPRAPERCRCGHHPWHHQEFVNSKGLPDLAGCFITGCECADYRPDQVQ